MPISKPYIDIHIYTNDINMIDWSYGQRLLESLGDESSNLYPDVWCSTLDSRTKPTYPGHAMSEENWARELKFYVDDVYSHTSYDDFCWLRRKRKLKSSGWISHAKTRLDGLSIAPGFFLFKAELTYDIDWWSLFLKWCEIFSPHLAVLHPYTEREQANRNSFMVYGGGSDTPYLTDVPWALVLGGKYLSEINPDQLRSMGFFVDSFASRSVVRLTENIEDVDRDYEYFCEQYAKLRSVLRDELFTKNE